MVKLFRKGMDGPLAAGPAPAKSPPVVTAASTALAMNLELFPTSALSLSKDIKISLGYLIGELNSSKN